MQKLTLSILLALFLISCKKKDTVNPCEGKQPMQALFVAKEIIGDTAFVADTIYRDNYVRFEALATYDSVQWKLGNDPRTFTCSSFALSFANDLVTIPINFKGFQQPNLQCFPTDVGIYSGVKQLTTVEQFDRATLTKSPMIGKYKGAYTDAPLDTFTIRIEYFDSAKYNPIYFGSESFYWVSNFPKGYKDSTSSMASLYPELREGTQPEMGYKALKMDWLSIDTYVWLVGRDSVYASELNAGKRRHFKGKRL